MPTTTVLHVMPYSYLFIALRDSDYLFMLKMLYSIINPRIQIRSHV
jgi:hypothetical protein